MENCNGLYFISESHLFPKYGRYKMLPSILQCTFKTSTFLGRKSPPPPQLASSSISAINTLILLQIGLSVTHDEQNIIHEEKTNVMVDKGNKSELGKLCWQFL